MEWSVSNERMNREKILLEFKKCEKRIKIKWIERSVFLLLLVRIETKKRLLDISFSSKYVTQIDFDTVAYKRKKKNSIVQTNWCFSSTGRKVNRLSSTMAWAIWLSTSQNTGEILINLTLYDYWFYLFF